MINGVKVLCDIHDCQLIARVKEDIVVSYNTMYSFKCGVYIEVVKGHAVVTAEKEKSSVYDIRDQRKRVKDLTEVAKRFNKIIDKLPVGSILKEEKQ